MGEEGKCINPEKKKDHPEGCTPEQIAECHPDAKDHPCEGEKE